MQKIKVNVSTLLEKLKANRKEHQETYVEAVEGYKKEAIEMLSSRLITAQETGKINLYFDLAPPSNNLKDYDRIIEMLEMTNDVEVELNQQEFASYVQDDWAWKGNFLRSNAMYSAKAADTFMHFEE